jgi:hypothetical protein
MISHLFYHQEQVEPSCARNSWLSIRDWFSPEDEVVVLDLGNTLTKPLPLERHPKFLRIEHVRTDKPEERSYTYGLNTLIPTCRFEWVFLWRSDYVYHRSYFPSAIAQLERADAVVPYESITGAEWCTARWCRARLDRLRSANDSLLVNNGSVCRTYQTLDFPHFAIRKSIWLKHRGMNAALWGYGYQFSELFYRLYQAGDVRIAVDFEMLAFHQNHSGSFGLAIYDDDKLAELKAAEPKLLDALGSSLAVNQFKAAMTRPLLREPRPDSAYRHRKSTAREFQRRLRGLLQHQPALLLKKAARALRRSVGKSGPGQ